MDFKKLSLHSDVVLEPLSQNSASPWKWNISCCLLSCLLGCPSAPVNPAVVAAVRVHCNVCSHTETNESWCVCVCVCSEMRVSVDIYQSRWSPCSNRWYFGNLFFSTTLHHNRFHPLKREDWLLLFGVTVNFLSLWPSHETRCLKSGLTDLSLCQYYWMILVYSRYLGVYVLHCAPTLKLLAG